MFGLEITPQSAKQRPEFSQNSETRKIKFHKESQIGIPKKLVPAKNSPLNKRELNRRLIQNVRLRLLELGINLCPLFCNCPLFRVSAYWRVYCNEVKARRARSESLTFQARKSEALKYAPYF